VIWCDVRVFPAAGRFLAALVLAGVAVVVGQLPAHACSCVSASVPKDIRAASDVFTGTITSVRTSGAARRGTVTYDVAVQRVYRGGVRTDDVTVTTARAARVCGLDSLRAHRRYLFFAKASGSELVIDSCGGTGPARSALVRQVEKVLGNGRAPSPAAPSPPPAEATFTAVSAGRPSSVTRLAAPGAALVLAGLLGLVVVRRLGKRAQAT
jgi:hypothetical protein